MTAPMLINRNTLTRLDAAQLQAARDSVGDILVAFGLGERAFLGSEYKEYSANALASTAQIPAAAPPTTAPSWVLWNGNWRESFIMLEAGCISISGTLGLGMGLIGGVTTQAQLAATMAAYAAAVVKGSQGGEDDSNARIVALPTLIGTPAYEVLAARHQVASVAVGSGLSAELKGSVIIPPRFGYALEVIAPLGTDALFTVSFKFAKVRLRLADA